MSPVVNGETHRFAARGLYDGLVLLGDRETGSYWNHITGECVYGALKGYQLDIYPLLHMNVAQTLTTHPDAQIAISKPAFRHRVMGRLMERGRKSRAGVMPPHFRRTMDAEDTRRPRMDMGLGVWTDKTQCYYPMERLHAHGDALVDELDGRRLLVYVDPHTGVPAALYTEAMGFTWRDSALQLDTGAVVRGGVFYDSQGERRSPARPMQLFTRWYGFAYTFPRCAIYGE